MRRVPVVLTLLALGLSALGLSACTGGAADAPQEPKGAPPSASVEGPVKAPDEAPAAKPLSVADMQGAVAIALVPSPVEMQRALERAGVTAELAGRVPTRARIADAADKDADKDQIAVRTGVALADLLLIAPSAEPAAVGERVLSVRAGLASLGASADTLAVLTSLDAEVRNGALSGDSLVRELDELSGSLLPRVEDEIGPRSLPLIRAGAWVEGAWLVSGAVIEVEAWAPSAELLRHPEVVSYFKGYVSDQGGERAPAKVLTQLDRSLATLGEVCARETFGEPEVRAVHDATGAVLELL